MRRPPDGGFQTASKLDYYQYLFLKYREVALQKARREISAGVAAKFGGDDNINAAFFSLLANKIGDNDSLAKSVVKLSLEMGGVSEDFAEEIISGLSDEMISKRALKILNMEGSSVNSAVCQYIAGSGGIEFTAEKADKSEKPSYEDAIGLFDMHLKEAFYLEFLDLAIDVFGPSLLSSLEASLERNRAHLNRARDGFLVKYFTLRQQVLIHYKNRGSGWADGYDRPTW